MPVYQWYLRAHTETMPHFALISASVRTGRKSHRVALHLQSTLLESDNTVDLLDLQALDLPLFHERLKFMTEPPAVLTDLSERIRKADGVIIVTPEYNGSFPASLKNLIDVFNEEWKGKPVGLCACSGGAFGGAQVMVELLFPLWKLKAWLVPSSFQVPKVQEQFNEDGTPNGDAEGWARRTKAFLDELGWAVEAKRRMEA